MFGIEPKPTLSEERICFLIHHTGIIVAPVGLEPTTNGL